MEREEPEAVAGGVLGRYRGLAEVLDHDPAALGDGFEAEAYFCLLVGTERSRPPHEHEPVRRLPHPDPPDLDDLASCAAQPRGVPVPVDGGVLVVPVLRGKADGVVALASPAATKQCRAAGRKSARRSRRLE